MHEGRLTWDVGLSREAEDAASKVCRIFLQMVSYLLTLVRDIFRYSEWLLEYNRKVNEWIGKGCMESRRV